MVEWVEFEPRPGQRIGFWEKYNKLAHLRAWTRVQRAILELAQGSAFATFEETLETLCGALAELVADWELVDEAGQALAKPTSPGAFYELTTGEDGEIAWIVGQLRRRMEPRPES